MSELPDHVAGQADGSGTVRTLGTIGFIGLGVMGRPMAANLLAAGADLVVYNRSRQALDELAAQGAASAGSPAEVAAEADNGSVSSPDSAASAQITIVVAACS